MVLSDKQLALLKFVQQKHGDQVRKYTNEPYCNHLIAVAQTVSDHEDNCIEIALCHDLFEDTNCDFNALYKEMLRIGYDRNYSYAVCSCVKELTDVFTHKDYPYLNRAKRKKNEALRLATISYRSQSVKYADLLDNGSSIMEHDKSFGEIYLKEKEFILSMMTDGNPVLFEMCKEHIQRYMQTAKQ